MGTSLINTQRIVSFVSVEPTVNERPQIKTSFGWIEMNDVNLWSGKGSIESIVPDVRDFEKVANQLCQKALDDAKRQLHPLLQNTGVERLEHRGEFLQALKIALEQRIARDLAIWQPGVQAVFKYDETRMENTEAWDGSIHLLVKVPRLSDALSSLAVKLDRGLVTCLNQLGWQRFRTSESILDVQQVTPYELRHGIGYGAMFFAVYTAPVKVWPRNRQAR